MNDLSSFRPSRAVPRVERAPLCVNQTEAVKVIGSPKLLKDLEGEGLVTPVSYGKPKWYSVVNLQRAVLEKVRRNQANPSSLSSRGFLVIPRTVVTGIEFLADGLRRRFQPSVTPRVGLN
jgi:hypothetical protein